MADVSISIRPATPADVPAILSLIRELAEYEKSLDKVVATTQNLHEDLFPTSGRPVCEAVMGEVNGVVEGFALFFHNYSTWVGRKGIYLEDLYVRPHARGVGLGKALFQRVVNIAVERGCHRMDWMVLDWNTPAHDFYKRMGAYAMAEWTMWRLEEGALKKAIER